MISSVLPADERTLLDHVFLMAAGPLEFPIANTCLLPVATLMVVTAETEQSNLRGLAKVLLGLMYVVCFLHELLLNAYHGREPTVQMDSATGNVVVLWRVHVWAGPLGSVLRAVYLASGSIK